jgi:hypothetical protein
LPLHLVQFTPMIKINRKLCIIYLTMMNTAIIKQRAGHVKRTSVITRWMSQTVTTYWPATTTPSTAHSAVKAPPPLATTIQTAKSIAQLMRPSPTWRNLKYSYTFCVRLYLAHSCWYCSRISFAFRGSAAGPVVSRSSRCVIFWYLWVAFFAAFLRIAKRAVLQMRKRVK